MGKGPPGPGIQACHFDPRPASDGWSVVPAAVYVKWAENCTFTRCTFNQLGGSAIWFSAGCNDCSVAGSHFEDISGNAVMVGDGRDRQVDGQVWWRTAPEQTAQSNSVVNNTREEDITLINNLILQDSDSDDLAVIEEAILQWHKSRK